MTDSTKAPSHIKLFEAILAGNRFDKSGSENEAEAAQSLTDIMVAFADVLRRPTPEVTGVELTVDSNSAAEETKSLIDELRALREAVSKMQEVIQQMRNDELSISRSRLRP